jgi:GGDEF domain-containing protein
LQAEVIALFAERVVAVREDESERHQEQLTQFSKALKDGQAEWGRVRPQFAECLTHYKEAAEKQIRQIRMDLASTAEALQEYVAAFVGQGADQERRLDQDLQRLISLREKKSLPEVQSGLDEVCEALTENLRRLKSQNQVIVGQLRDEIRTLQKRLEQAQRRVENKAGNLSHRLAFERRLEERITRDEIFSLFLVRIINWNAVLERETKDFVLQLTDVVSAHLKESLGRETFSGRWYDGYFAAIVPVDKRMAFETSESLARNLTRSYSVTAGRETRSVDLKARTAVIDHVKGQSPEHMLRRVDQLIRAFES